MAVDLSIYLPENLSNDFWIEFLEAISDEMEFLKTEILDPLKYFTYLRNQTDSDTLIEISQTYGFIPNRRVLSDSIYLNLIAQLVNYKIKYKSSYVGYDFIFKAIETLGYTYNLYLFNEKLIRGLNDTEIVSVLNDVSTDLSDPFLYFLPEFYYSESAVEIDQLDEGGTLDESGGIPTLDDSYITRPTQHLSYEYTPFELITVDSIEYMMTTNYMEYLLEESLYNKKASEIPHAGFQINSIMDLSGFFDNLSGASYSTPDLKIICGTTVQNYFFNGTEVFLDETPSSNLTNMDLDKTSPWVLDQVTPTFTTGDITETFYEICVGSGNQGILSSTYPDLNNSLIGYWDFNDAGTGNIYDRGPNTYNGTLSGTYTFGKGIIGNGVSFNGSTGIGSIPNVVLTDTPFTLNFWIDSKSTQSTGFNIFDWEDTIMIGGISAGVIGVNIVGSSGSANVSISYDLDDTDRMISLVYDPVTSNLASLYVNGVFANSANISGVGSIAGTRGITVAKRKNVVGDLYRGIIDEIRLYDDILTANELLFLYSNRIGNLNYLDEELESSTTAIDNRYEDPDWYIISGIYRFYDRTSYDPDELEEEVTFSELAIKNIDGNVVAYSTFPSAIIKKRFHLGFQFYIKKTT
jgi:hypothetical protein